MTNEVTNEWTKTHTQLRQSIDNKTNVQCVVYFSWHITNTKINRNHSVEIARETNGLTENAAAYTWKWLQGMKKYNVKLQDLKLQDQREVASIPISEDNSLTPHWFVEH